MSSFFLSAPTQLTLTSAPLKVSVALRSFAVKPLLSAHELRKGNT